MDSKWPQLMNEARPPVIDRAAATALIEPLTEIVIRAGDAILVQVASEFQAQVRRRECLARVGGDEFAVLVPDVSEEEITLLAERLVKAIAGMPIRYTGQDLRLGCSVGIAIYPWHTRQPDDLMACADAAMYLAKDAGKNRWCMLPTAPPRHAGDT